MDANLNDGKLDISINKGNKDELTPQDASNPKLESKDIEKPSISTQAINTALISAGKGAINQGIDMYGRMTGNLTLTANIASTTGLLADIGIIACGGPVGAIAVFSKYMLGAANAYVDTVNQNRQINYNKQILGQISREGSRYW